MSLLRRHPGGQLQGLELPSPGREVLGQAQEFVGFLHQIEQAVPANLDLHVILDNSSTHKTPEVKEFLQAHPRVQLHFTPTSASWLNAVEGRFSLLERRCLYRGVFTSAGQR
jgi:transposase